MTPLEIYAKYRINSGLQLHQLRVAAVALMVARRFREPVREHDIICAALLHDMGNILKAELERMPELCEPEGVAYWQGVKQEFAEKYGTDEHHATLEIVRDIGMSDRVIDILDGIGFGKIARLLESNDYEKQLVEYGDLRVAPHGVLSVRERAEDGRRRYRARMTAQGRDVDNYFDMLIMSALELEREISDKTGLVPEDITDVAIAPFIEELKEYRIL